MTASSSHRPTIAATQHAISAGHYLAATAGFEILQAGGNAIDAGCAAGIALGVLQSDLVDVAGVAPIMIYLADRQEVVTIAGLGPWPRALDPELFQREHRGKIPKGVLRTVVPAAPDAWITALERYGTMSFGEVAGAAIRLAHDGFPMYPLMAESLRRHEADHRAWPSTAAIFLPDGRPPQTGELFRQTDLAASLQYMSDAERGAASRGREAGLAAARDAFYRGDIARKIVAFMKEQGGLLSAEDLAEYRSPVGPPERRRFGDLEVFTCGAWCQGPVLLQTLALLEGTDLAALGQNSADYIHQLAEALKLAFADREAYYGDPAMIDVPLATLTSPEYAAERRKLIHADHAMPEMPPPGDLGRSAGQPHGPATGRARLRSSPGEPNPEPDTSYVCVADRYGNLFSATPSDGSYGSPVVPGTGLIPSNRGSQSRPDPRHPSGVGPGKRPRLTPNPALAIKGRDMFLPFGTPGGDVQTQAMLQVLLNLFVFGNDVQSAIEAPRFATYSFPSSFAPFDYYPGRLALESRIPQPVIAELARRGHEIQRWPDWIWTAGAV
ncbi:MAG: gamma-glutamyltransferase, partial [Alphaproteobacteria bacterium]|nr:gamma-glutamyltransferase [Alphaproteobacteria bacterium]